ncbi:hypothetical protein [Janthinobacterium sp.]|uniref:hypothetical protein n=1 Tax=Janthinobacterium sp. TaxID=1871054 RepID=UPI00289D30F8|nr:hypothetical protein [Janthinobacterium sp.]
MKNFKNSFRLISTTTLAAVLAACGGGNDAVTPPVIDSPKPSVVSSGTAAIGSPIVGGQVTMKCASGSRLSAVTEAAGTWTASLKATDYPCVIQMTGGTVGGKTFTGSLYSAAMGAGTANITPLTDLLLATMVGQLPATWYASATNGNLAGSITPTTTSAGMAKVKAALSTLPGKLSLPDNFDPVTTGFNAVKGNEVDDLLEVYGAVLTAAGLTQEDAGKAASAGAALTKEAFALTAFTTPNLTTIKMGSSKNLDDTFSLSISDPNRGNITTKAARNTDGNIVSLNHGSPFNGFVSLMGNRIGQLCTDNTGGFNGHMASQYVYVSSDLMEVTDPTELFGKSFDEYEDCAAYGTSQITANGNFIFTEKASGKSDSPDVNFVQALTSGGYVNSAGGSLVRGKVYKTKDASPTYLYVIVSTKLGATTPKLNADTDYVVMGISH